MEKRKVGRAKEAEAVQQAAESEEGQAHTEEKQAHAEQDDLQVQRFKLVYGLGLEKIRQVMRQQPGVGVQVPGEYKKFVEMATEVKQEMEKKEAEVVVQQKRVPVLEQTHLEHKQSMIMSQGGEEQGGKASGVWVSPRRKRSQRTRPLKLRSYKTLGDGEVTAEHEEPVKEPSGEVQCKKRAHENTKPLSQRKSPRQIRDGSETISVDSQSGTKTAVTIEREATGRVCVLNFFSLDESEAAASRVGAESQARYNFLMPITPVVETTRLSVVKTQLPVEETVAELSDAVLERLRKTEENEMKLKTMKLKLRGLNLLVQNTAALAPPSPPGLLLDQLKEQEQHLLALKERQETAKLYSEFLAAFETFKHEPGSWLQQVMNEYVGYKEKIKSVESAGVSGFGLLNLEALLGETVPRRTRSLRRREHHLWKLGEAGRT